MSEFNKVDFKINADKEIITFKDIPPSATRILSDKKQNRLVNIPFLDQFIDKGTNFANKTENQFFPSNPKLDPSLTFRF